MISGMSTRRGGFSIPYGDSDFRTIRNEGLYYVDKTMYLAQLEEHGAPPPARPVPRPQDDPLRADFREEDVARQGRRNLD